MIVTAPRHGDEQQQVAEWLFPLLAGDPELGALLTGLPTPSVGQAEERIWPDIAPVDTAGRWCVYSPQAAFDVRPVGAYPRLMTPVPVNVRLIARGDDTGWLAAGQRRLLALLQGNHNTVLPGGGTILTGVRDSVLYYPEIAGGIRYQHAGGIFTVQVN